MATIRVEAEAYRDGANGLAYLDTSPGNSGGALRNGDVVIQASDDGGYNVGWISSGEWLSYNVNVPENGLYRLNARVSGDTDIEPDEAFTVTLSNPSGGASITTATAIGIIRNDDVISGGEPATQFPADLSSGHTWQALKEWSFTGVNGSPPPAPWQTAPGWAAAHSKLGGHIWRDAVNSDSKAYVDGNGHLRLDIDYSPQYKVVETGYLITYPDDGSQPGPTAYKAAPTEEGIYIEARVQFPNGAIPTHTWFAFWTYNSQDKVGSPRGEIDIVEYTPANAWSAAGFTANTHGGGNPRGPLHANVNDGDYGSGTFVFPAAEWGGDEPADGDWHTYGLFWSTTEQRFYYDGFNYWTRSAANGEQIHQDPQDIRLTIEAGQGVWGGRGTQAESYARGEFDDSHVLVDYVRVFDRKADISSDLF